jgi:hypothetical protein
MPPLNNRPPSVARIGEKFETRVSHVQSVFPVSTEIASIQPALSFPEANFATLFTSYEHTNEDGALLFAPWRAGKIAGGNVVRDATGHALAYVYSRDNEDEARQESGVAARLNRAPRRSAPIPQAPGRRRRGSRAGGVGNVRRSAMAFGKKPQMTSAEFTAALREAGFGVDHGRTVDVSGRCPGLTTSPSNKGVVNRNATLSKATWERDVDLARPALN